MQAPPPDALLELVDGPAYQRGKPHISTAFLLSAPGSNEAKHGYPAAGPTGAHINIFLGHAHPLHPDIFPSSDLRDYRIVNAWPFIEHRKLTKRTEADYDELRDPRIINRLERALDGITTVVALGERAQFAIELTRYKGRIITGNHPSPTYINTRLKSTAPTGPERRLDRLRQYSHAILAQLK